MDRNELQVVTDRISTTMLDIAAKSVNSMSKLMGRLDEVDDAIHTQVQEVGLDKMTTKELFAYFAQVQSSFRTRQEFLHTLANYNVNTKNVPVEEIAQDNSTIDSAKLEMLKRALAGMENK